MQENDNNFNTSEKTGGEKSHKLTVAEMPIHTVEQNPHNHAIINSITFKQIMFTATGTNSADMGQGGITQRNVETIATNKPIGGDQAHNNLQPYITCYMYKRIA